MNSKNISTKTVFTSDQLRFESYDRCHVEDLFLITKDNWPLTKYMCWNPPSDIDETYKNFDSRPAKDRAYDFVILCENTVIGRIAVRDFVYASNKTVSLKSVNIGYWIGTDFQNQGFGTKTIEKVKEICFEDLGAQKITGECFAQNTTSARVFAKTGFKFVKKELNAIKKNETWVDLLYFECSKNRSSTPSK